MFPCLTKMIEEHNHFNKF